MLGIAALVFLGVTHEPSAVEFSAPDVDEVVDLHGDPIAPDLVLFVAGNQWFVMPELLQAFQAEHPEVKTIFYETLPPGILAKQLVAGTLALGNLRISVQPDVYMAGRGNMARVRALQKIDAPVAYARNELAIMVHVGNPKHIVSVKDLGRPDVRVAMPNPAWEGVARVIEGVYEKAGGDRLQQTIMQTKVADGSTLLTKIHHRETPMWLLDGKVDAGPVWLSEALYQEKIHSGLVAVRIPEQDNDHAFYEAAVVSNAPHRAIAAAFVRWIATPSARAIYASYGFAPPR